MQQRQSSCLTCRNRKVKCDKKEPCGRCIKTNNSNCVYPRQGTLGRPPKNAVFHGKGRNNSVRNLIIREFIFENVGGNQSKTINSNSNTSSVSAITSGLYVNSEWWILSKEAIEHHCINTYFQTIYSFYVLRSNAIRERFNTATYRLPEKPRLKFNNLQLLFTWWSSLSVNLLIKRTSQVQLETYSVPSLTLYMFQMNDSPTTLDSDNDQTDRHQRHQPTYSSSSPSSSTTSTTSSLSLSSSSSSSSSRFSPSPSPTPLPAFPRMHHQQTSTDPLRSLPSQQAINLINDFFLVHPHSILINKSKLMNDYWADTANPLLLSVIYGTTQCFSQLLQGIPMLLWESGTESNRNPFLNHAYSLLEALPTSPSTSDYQASVILALFEIVWGYPKMGMSLLATTYLLGTHLGLWDKSFKPADPIEEELVNMAFWSVFRATTHGCIEMGASIVDTLVYHQRSFPPVNIHESKSYQHNASNNINDTSHHAYLIESFYSGAVVTYYSGILFACLPKPYVNVYGIKTEDWTFEGSELLTMLRTIKDVETRVHMVLDDFNGFIQQQRHIWSPIQLYTIETSYRLYRIHLRFLQPTHTCGTRKYQEDLIPAAATGENDNNKNTNNNNASCYFNFVIDPSDPTTTVRLCRVLDDLFPMVDELEAILTLPPLPPPPPPSEFANTTTNDFEPMGAANLVSYELMVAVYETSARLLMLNYQLDPSQRLYNTMMKLLAIAKLLDTLQPPSIAMKNVRQRMKTFMKQHYHRHHAPTTTAASTKEEEYHLPPSFDRINNDGIDYNNDTNAIDVNFDIQQFFLHPFLQQQQTQQNSFLIDPSWQISLLPPSSSLLPYHHQQYGLLPSSSPMPSSSSYSSFSSSFSSSSSSLSSGSSSSSSHLVQYPDTHLTSIATEVEQQPDSNDNGQGNMNTGSDGGLLPILWNDPSSFIDWDNMIPQSLPPYYDVSLSFLEQDHQDLGYMPFLNI